MSTIEPTHAVVDGLIAHGYIAVEDAQRALRAGDRQHAVVRLLEAADLYRLAAHELDPEVPPTGLIKVD